jgi:hypothetical protein
MNAIEVIVTGPEEAYNNEAEFWCATKPTSGSRPTEEAT